MSHPKLSSNNKIGNPVSLSILELIYNPDINIKLRKLGKISFLEYLLIILSVLNRVIVIFGRIRFFK